MFFNHNEIKKSIGNLENSQGCEVKQHTPT